MRAIEEKRAAQLAPEAAHETGAEPPDNKPPHGAAQGASAPRAMSQCPKYAACDAAFCPLDPKLWRRVRQKGDRVCFYLTEAVKEGAAVRFKPRADEDIYLVAVKVLAEEERLDSALKKRLREAAESGSQIKRGRQLVANVEDASTPATLDLPANAAAAA